MKLRNTGLLAAAAVLIGLAGASATGCLNLDTGTSLPTGDSLDGPPGLDEPGTTDPGNNVVPIFPEGR